MTWPVIGDTGFHVKIIKQIMESKYDVVVAIFGGAMLEEAVERTLKERMRADGAVAERLFDLAKPLASTTARIDTLYMLWGIDVKTRNALLSLYRIRNFFAHNLGASFESTDKKYTKNLSRLVLHESTSYYPDPRYGTPTSIKIEDIVNNRILFIVNLKLALNALMQDRCSHKAYSTIPVTHEELNKLVGEPMR